MPMASDLYGEFDSVYARHVVPVMEDAFPRSWNSDPIYYYLDNIYTRRFRSALPILLSVQEGIDPSPLCVTGAATEILWAGLLVMDDIIDEDRERTGFAAARLWPISPLRLRGAT